MIQLKDVSTVKLKCYGAFRVNGKEGKVLPNRNPEELPWGELGVDIVLECTWFHF